MNKYFRIFILFSTFVLNSQVSHAITFAIANDPNGVFEGTSTGTNPSTGLDTSEFNLQAAYQNLYGSASPNALPTRSIWGESPTLMSFGFEARGDNVKVDVFQELDLDVFGNYWTLDSKLTFDPSSAIIVDPNDHIMWDGTLTHTGKFSTNDFPHEGDDQSGPPLKFSIDLSAGDKTDALFGQLTHALDVKVGEHPSVGHDDVMIGVMQARVTSPSIFLMRSRGPILGSWSACILMAANRSFPNRLQYFYWAAV